MARQRVLNSGGLNLYVNPLNKKSGDLLRAVNVDSFPYGGKRKRSGYTTYLGTANGSAVNTLFAWNKNDGTTLYTYRASGSALYYSTQGTGAWTICGNGTIGAGAHVGYAVLDNTLVVCDGVGSTRHTTSGTSFTNTTLAPVAVDLGMYQNRIFAAGTSSILFYSTTGDATNWATSGTSDSSSLTIPGEGKLNKLFTSSDRLIATKNSNLMYKWDGYSLVDMTTDMGPSSPYSVDKSQDYFFWLNNTYGIVGYGGGRPQLLSNAVNRQIFNNMGSGVAAGTFSVAAGAVSRYDYYLSIGTVTDDFTNESVPNAILKHDFQKNEFLNYSFANFPTAWTSYTDRTGARQLIFGDNNGQCYTFGNSQTTDNGVAIEAIMEYMTGMEIPELDKTWKHFWAFFNPGCNARVQVAIENTYVKQSKKWMDVGDATSGVAYFRFPQGSVGKFLFVRIMESSKNSLFEFYGFSVDADPIPV